MDEREFVGFILIELLTVMFILSVVAALAQPNLVELKASFDRKNARQNLEYDLRQARSEALSRSVRIITTLAADGKSYTVGEDVLPYETANGTAAVSKGSHYIVRCFRRIRYHRSGE